MPLVYCFFRAVVLHCLILLFGFYELFFLCKYELDQSLYQIKITARPAFKTVGEATRYHEKDLLRYYFKNGRQILLLILT